MTKPLVRVSSAETFVVFRYRDLVASTIEEHQQVIKKKGAVWWGWWKRPSEDARSDVWEGLSRQVKTKEVTVLLFHSGSGEVREATVSQIIPPVGDGESRPGVPQGQIDQVPAYYRRSPYSRAWLRITGIGRAIVFFNKYSYAVPPPLPGIPSAAAVRALANKRVVDLHEMASMDTTIWQVRRSKTSDSSEHFLAPSTRLASPVDTHPVPLKGDVLLHLTDLHYAVDEHRKQHEWALPGESSNTQVLADQIEQSLHAADESPNAVVVSGDITFTASADEFRRASTGLVTLSDGHLGISRDQLIVVPGNHDLKWTSKKQAVAGVDVELTALSEHAADEYRSFFRTLVGIEPSDDLGVGRRYVTPAGQVVEIVGVNSSNLERGKHFLEGIGRVGVPTMEKIFAKMGWNEREPSTALRVLTLHHHVAMLENVESASEYRGGFGSALDAVGVMRSAARHGVHVILHGHRHRPFISYVNSYEILEEPRGNHDLRGLCIIGGGTCASPSRTSGMSFNLLKVRPGKVTVELWWAANRNETFKRSKTWSARTELTDSGLAIAPWAADTTSAPGG